MSLIDVRRVKNFIM